MPFDINTVYFYILTFNNMSKYIILLSKYKLHLSLYINNLNPDININRFVNIPEAESRIKELELFINEIDLDIDRIHAK